MHHQIIETKRIRQFQQLLLHVSQLTYHMPAR